MVYIYLILGLGLILGGASVFTDAASSLAKKFNISDFIIGLTVVAIGTSMPEVVVSLIAAIKGNGAMAIGNVVGSNLFNTLVIVGITVIVSPINLTKGNVRRDIPIGVGASALLLAITLIAHLSGSMKIGRLEGLLLLALFVLFIAYTVREGKKSTPEMDINTKATNEPTESIKPRAMWQVVALIILGLGGLVAGGEFFLGSAIEIARALNISDAVIAITIMSAGTSLPELATCVVAAAKGKGDMALGNVVGSNISNILLVIGAGAVATPLSFGDITIADIVFVLATAVLLFVAAFTFKKRQIDRYEGVILVLLYVLYICRLLGVC